VLDARNARWGYTLAVGHGLPLTGIDDAEAEALFPMHGLAMCASSRQFQKDGPWGYYCSDPVAEGYNASSPEDTRTRMSHTDGSSPAA
jgi:hypothetical protein